jgi:hypothetical protein
MCLGSGTTKYLSRDCDVGFPSAATCVRMLTTSQHSTHAMVAMSDARCLPMRGGLPAQFSMEPDQIRPVAAIRQET